MTQFETQILSKLTHLTKEVATLKQLVRQEVWLTEKEVIEKYGYSKKSLQVKRRELSADKDYRCSTTGRKFQYNVKALERLFGNE